MESDLDTEAVCEWVETIRSKRRQTTTKMQKIYVLFVCLYGNLGGKECFFDFVTGSRKIQRIIRWTLVVCRCAYILWVRRLNHDFLFSPSFVVETVATKQHTQQRTNTFQCADIFSTNKWACKIRWKKTLAMLVRWA